MRLAEECYEGVARASGKILPRPHRRLIGQVITLPVGERVVVIAVTAVCFGPRLTFLVLLAWGAVAAGYVLASQLAAAAKLAAAGKLERARGVLPAYRGDGPIAHWIGGVVRGQLPPLPPLLVGLLVTCDLVVLGVADLSGLLIFGPVLALLLAALGARHPHAGRLDWLVPPLLLVGEGVFLTGLGLARHVWLPVIFALLAAVVLRHADLAYRARVGRGIPDDKYGLGWDGRILLAGFAALLGIVPFAYAVLAAWLWLLVEAGTSSAAGSKPRTRSTCRRRRPAWPRSRTSSRRWPGTAWPAPPRPAAACRASGMSWSNAAAAWS